MFNTALLVAFVCASLALGVPVDKVCSDCDPLVHATTDISVSACRIAGVLYDDPRATLHDLEKGLTHPPASLYPEVFKQLLQSCCDARDRGTRPDSDNDDDGGVALPHLVGLLPFNSRSSSAAPPSPTPAETTTPVQHSPPSPAPTSDAPSPTASPAPPASPPAPAPAASSSPQRESPSSSPAPGVVSPPDAVGSVPSLVSSAASILPAPSAPATPHGPPLVVATVSDVVGANVSDPAHTTVSGVMGSLPSSLPPSLPPARPSLAASPSPPSRPALDSGSLVVPSLPPKPTPPSGSPVAAPNAGCRMPWDHSGENMHLQLCGVAALAADVDTVKTLPGVVAHAPAPTPPKQVSSVPGAVSKMRCGPLNVDANSPDLDVDVCASALASATATVTGTVTERVAARPTGLIH